MTEKLVNDNGMGQYTGFRQRGKRMVNQISRLDEPRHSQL